MLIALVAGSMISMSSVACPPTPDGSSSVQTTVTVMAAATPRAEVKVSEAPFEPAYTDAMLNKVWITLAENATVKDFTAAVGKAAEREVFVDWKRLGEAGITPESEVRVPLNHVYIEQAFRIVNERVTAGSTGKIAARRSGDLIEISTQDTFDRREKKTVSFDLRPLTTGLDAAAAAAKHKEILGAMMSTIEPEGWTENGGDTARTSMAEGRLFVVAPPRIQKAVAWFFGQVSDQPLAGAEVLRAGEPVQMMQIEPVQVNHPGGAGHPAHPASARPAEVNVTLD